MKTELPNNFIIGASTSSYQIEDNNINSDWYDWDTTNHLSEEKRCNSWEHFIEDIELIKDFGIEAYRMSIEWSRIFPVPDKIDNDALHHYEKIFALLKENNIKIYLTLQHHTLPKWLKKGWLNKNIVEEFTKYVRVVAKQFYYYVDAWMPINEPAVNNAFGYYLKTFPPGYSSFSSAFKAAKNQMKCYLEAYKILKETKPDIPVGFVKQIIIFKPYRNNFFDKLLANYYDNAFNEQYIKAFKNGKLPFSRKNISELKDSIDFWALNYYTHQWVSTKFKGNRKFSINKKEVETSQMGWEWDTEGLKTAIKRLWNTKQIPVIITENGLASNEDNKRELFIYLHLKAAYEMIKENVDVQGYFYWSLIDCYEWGLGYKPKFGLSNIQSKSLKRKPRDSGYYLGNISKSKELILP